MPASFGQTIVPASVSRAGSGGTLASRNVRRPRHTRVVRRGRPRLPAPSSTRTFTASRSSGFASTIIAAHRIAIDGRSSLTGVDHSERKMLHSDNAQKVRIDRLVQVPVTARKVECMDTRPGRLSGEHETLTPPPANPTSQQGTLTESRLYGSYRAGQGTSRSSPLGPVLPRIEGDRVTPERPGSTSSAPHQRRGPATAADQVVALARVLSVTGGRRVHGCAGHAVDRKQSRGPDMADRRAAESEACGQGE